VVRHRTAAAARSSCSGLLASRLLSLRARSVAGSSASCPPAGPEGASSQSATTFLRGASLGEKYECALASPSVSVQALTSADQLAGSDAWPSTFSVELVAILAITRQRSPSAPHAHHGRVAIWRRVGDQMVGAGRELPVRSGAHVRPKLPLRQVDRLTAVDPTKSFGNRAAGPERWCIAAGALPNIRGADLPLMMSKSGLPRERGRRR
jgi:hypothetical protein